MASPRKNTNTDGRVSYDGIYVPHADFSHTNINYVSFNQANLSETRCFQTGFSVCTFHGTNFNKAQLINTVMICSSFTNETTFLDADVNGSLILLSTCGQDKITQQWLKEKGAVNSEKAITDLQTLLAVIASKNIDKGTVEHYMKQLNEVHIALYSTNWKKNNSIFTDPNTAFLLPYSKPENLDVIKQAYLELKNYVSQKEYQPSTLTY